MIILVHEYFYAKIFVCGCSIRMKIIKFPDLRYYIMIQSDDDQVEEIGGEPQDRDRGSVSDDSKHN